MIVNNIKQLFAKFQISNLSLKVLKAKLNCPIIKINIKDLHKYQTSLYSILNKMEENFESKLPKLGKIKFNNNSNQVSATKQFKTSKQRKN
jgi:hypothetical protein